MFCWRRLHDLMYSCVYSTSVRSLYCNMIQYNNDLLHAMHDAVCESFQ